MGVDQRKRHGQLKLTFAKSSRSLEFLSTILFLLKNELMGSGYQVVKISLKEQTVLFLKLG